jgi:hypothetical protein
LAWLHSDVAWPGAGFAAKMGAQAVDATVDDDNQEHGNEDA